MKENLVVTKVATQFAQVLTCANCIVANRLQRNTSQQFFVDKVYARSPWVAPIQSGSMIGQLAYALVTISHHDEKIFRTLVQPSNFLDPLPQFIILRAYLQYHQNRCCVP